MQGDKLALGFAAALAASTLSRRGSRNKPMGELDPTNQEQLREYANNFLIPAIWRIGSIPLPTLTGPKPALRHSLRFERDYHTNAIYIVLPYADDAWLYITPLWEGDTEIAIQLSGEGFGPMEDGTLGIEAIRRTDGLAFTGSPSQDAKSYIALIYPILSFLESTPQARWGTIRHAFAEQTHPSGRVFPAGTFTNAFGDQITGNLIPYDLGTTTGALDAYMGEDWMNELLSMRDDD